MRQTARQFLLALLTLLQCAAPLAHAHMDGMNTGHVAHTHKISVHAPLAAGSAHVERHEGAVISMPEARPTSEAHLPDYPATAQISNTPITLPDTAACSLPQLASTDIANSHYLSPWAQAPPRIILSA